MDVHVGGTPWPPVLVTESGAQKPPGHAASCDWSAIGTSDVGTQCEPAHAGLHAGNPLGSMMGGPVYGQEMTVGGFAGLSHASEHAPVGAVGSAETGLKQGAQRSSAAHTSCGKTSFSAWICGRHVERQRPSALAIDVHLVGRACPSDWMNVSGAQKPGAPLLMQLASCA